MFNKKSNLWASQRKKPTGFEGKTLWDKLNLFGTLAIPLIIAFATIGVGGLQLHLADVQHQADQQNALDQQRATILQTYIDNIQDLLLHDNLLKSSADPSNPYYDIGILARARTLTALQGLDPERKSLLVQFIYEARLIGFVDSTGKPIGPIINLFRANLNGANLMETFLIGADLDGANLNGADLNGAYLLQADLVNANLMKANLFAARLDGARLDGARLDGANLNEANLNEANLNEANLKGATGLTNLELELETTLLQGTIMPDGSKHP